MIQAIAKQFAIAVVVSAICALSLPVATQASQLNFPGKPPGPRILKAQVKAEREYDAGNYKDAFWYYRKELAPIGDKYAQYMVGYMLEHGLGTPRDPVAAAAWFHLAAERGHEPLVDTYRQYNASLTDTENASVQAALTELKVEYSDRSLIERLIRIDTRRLNEMTGTRTGTCNSANVANTRVIGARDTYGDGFTNGYRYCRFIEKRINLRLEYLGGYVEFGELELLPDEEDID
ncbi:MAG: hypothetical protein AAAFM81_07310 [Pseudomonadota bacterium]